MELLPMKGRERRIARDLPQPIIRRQCLLFCLLHLEIEEYGEQAGGASEAREGPFRRLRKPQEIENRRSEYNCGKKRPADTCEPVRQSFPGPTRAATNRTLSSPGTRP